MCPVPEGTDSIPRAVGEEEIEVVVEEEEDDTSEEEDMRTVILSASYSREADRELIRLLRNRLEEEADRYDMYCMYELVIVLLFVVFLLALKSSAMCAQGNNLARV